LPFVPQFTVNRPADPVAAGFGFRTFGCTFRIATNWSRLVAASAVPLPPDDTNVTVSAPVAARTTAAMASLAGLDRTSRDQVFLRFMGDLLEASRPGAGGAPT
jgi:hypothetical protein